MIGETNFTIFVYELIGSKNGKKHNISHDFFTFIKNISFNKRWKPEPEGDNLATQIPTRNFSLIDWLAPGKSKHRMLYGKFKEVTPTEKISLTKLSDGEDYDIPISEKAGKKTEEKDWKFMISPQHNMLFLETKGRGIENKIKDFLNSFVLPFSDNYKDHSFDNITISGIPKESNPVWFLRKNPHLKSFEFALNAKAIKNDQFGIFSTLTGDDKLKVKISISATNKGEELPHLLISDLANFLESADNNYLHQVQVKEVGEKPIKLLNALERREIVIDNENEWVDSMLIIAEEIIDDLSKAISEN